MVRAKWQPATAIALHSRAPFMPHVWWPCHCQATTMSVEQKTNINFHAKFGIASTETLDLLKAVMSCNTIGANHVTCKSVRLAQEVQEAEERVHVEVEGEGSSLKGSMPPSIGHMELLVWMQRADFSEHIQGCKSPGDPLNSSHFDAPNTKSAPTGYRRAPNIISHHYKQQLSAKASIVPKARPIRFR